MARIGAALRFRERGVLSMKTSNLRAGKLGAFGAAALLIGCAGGAPLSPSAVPIPTRQNAGSVADTQFGERLFSAAIQNRVVGAARPDRGRSWMDPNAKKNGLLLYVSDSAADDVTVFSYPQGKVVGTLSGFQQPQGMCVDKAGDIFITNTGLAQILEYAHGGTTPIATLSDPGQHPIGCSVDPKTGNLAVTNIFDDSYSNGSLSIYAHARGKPKHYTDPAMIADYFCGYDNKGNVFVDGTKPTNYGFAFAELRNGTNTLRNVTLDQAIQAPGGVQWDGQYIAIADQEAPIIYRFAIAGRSGTEVGATQTGGSSDVVQFFIKHKTLVGPNATSGQVMFWNYPAGGTQTKILGGFEVPIGTAISSAKS
jgi:DNA-binding beta-propeller fold protein YncE